MRSARLPRCSGRVARGAVLALLWHGLWVTDLTEPLSPDSILTPGTQAA